MRPPAGEPACDLDRPRPRRPHRGGRGRVRGRQRFRPIDVTVAPAVAMGGTPGAGPPRPRSSPPNGYVVARQHASVSTEIAGRLEALYVGEGSRVQKGQVLASSTTKTRRPPSTRRTPPSDRRKPARGSNREPRRIETQLKRATEMMSRSLLSQSDLDAAVAKGESRPRARHASEGRYREAESNSARRRSTSTRPSFARPFAGAVLRRKRRSVRSSAPSRRAAGSRAGPS